MGPRVNFINIFFAPVCRPVPRWGAYPSDPQLVTSPLDIPTSSSAWYLHLPFRHLAINLISRGTVATSMRKLQRKHSKMWRNATLFMMIFVVKKTKDKRKKRWHKGNFFLHARVKINTIFNSYVQRTKSETSLLRQLYHLQAAIVANKPMQFWDALCQKLFKTLYIE